MSTDDVNPDFSEAFGRLKRDLKKSAEKLSRRDARFLVDMYYVVQDYRIRAASQRRTSEEEGEPHALISWVFSSFRQLESSIKAALGEFAMTYRTGRWLNAQYGIGPVISAGLLSQFDIREAETVGHFWSFAGLNPKLIWLGTDAAKKLLKDLGVSDKQPFTPEMMAKIAEVSGRRLDAIQDVYINGIDVITKTTKSHKKGEEGLAAWLAKRPWNARLKSLCLFRMGECFIKFNTRDECYYGKHYARKKAELVQHNERGDFAARAAAELESKEKRMRKDAKRLEHWRSGKLAPAHLDDMARRWAVKLLVSHLHEVMTWDYHGHAPRLPYIWQYGDPNHTPELFKPPHFNSETYLTDFGGKQLKEMLD